MKLRNKKTGEIREAADVIIENLKKNGSTLNAINIDEVRNEWEDYEEPKDKGYWYIDDFGRIQFSSEVMDEIEGRPNNWIARKLFGNYFETREEAEKAVEKLKAWKRLKDKGFRFNSCKIEMSEIVVPEITITAFIDTEEPETLNLVNLLFGGEE